ncbi:hypothetical protein F4679DRAFT_567475 [Xylaria curta]|nr:hypothetical protein F4679DRAFT_567475 [Xylaria curta]
MTKMSTIRKQADVSRLSLDSLNMEHRLEDGNSETEFSHSQTATHVVVKRRFQPFHQTIADIQQGRSNLKLWFLFALFLSTVSFLINVLLYSSINLDGHCSVDGSFSPFYFSLHDLWRISDFFQVNIAIGNLTFTQAKVADISWDLVVGRGGQAILSFITWKVFVDYAALSMTTRPITFATYRTLFAETGPSLSSTIRLIHDFIRYKGLASKLASAFIIYSMILALVLPILAGAATGYVPVNEAFIRDFDSNLVEFSRFQANLVGFSRFQGNFVTNHWFWEYANKTYEIGDIEARGRCVLVKDRYKWGASLLQMLFLFILVSFWVVGCFILLISNHARHQYPKDFETPKGYQALGILIESIEEQLLGSDAKVSAVTDGKMRSEIKAKLAGGSISFNPPRHINAFRRWFNKERAWFICLCISLAITLISYPASFAIWDLWIVSNVFFFVSLGILFAIIVGRTLGSRLILVLCWAVLSGITTTAQCFFDSL